MNGIVSTGVDWIEKRGGGEFLRVEAWSENCIRVRCTLARHLEPHEWAIEPKTAGLPVTVREDSEAIVLTNGKLSVSLLRGERGLIDVPETPLRFQRADTGAVLLEEKQSRVVLPDPGRGIRAVEPASYRVEVRFQADPRERFYGLGQNQQGFFDQKGCSLELCQMNSHTVVPVLYSSKGYGFFWNNPAYGRVELVNNGTYWIAEKTDQIDYFVFVGDHPAEVMNMYARLTGFPSMMPDWAMGFWQSKLRYRNREELLNVAREHKRRGLPMSVIVIDFFHWERMGEWDFDPKCWPDPEQMIGELKQMGIETMVSIWPTVNAESSHFREMLERDFLVRADHGLPVFLRFTDTYEKTEYLHFTDFLNEEAGRYVWDIVKRNYYDRGVRLFWLDVCEPEIRPLHPQNLRYHLGNGAKVSSLFPLFEAKAFYEGMKAAGEELPVNLCRSAWAGSQKYGACVWSGDIFSNFQSFRDQIKNGLNMAMAGIPWWTTDIGGFFGGKTRDPEFRELVVRWFQWAVFCPVFRLHGFRDSWDVKQAGDNEVWSFGEEEYAIIKELLFLRERLRPYIKEQMRAAHETGTPPMRPLFFDFPGDDNCYPIGDQLLFGPDILVAPVTEYGRRSREVYLPSGQDWKDSSSGRTYRGGQSIHLPAPMEWIPVLTRADSAVRIEWTRPDNGSPGGGTPSSA